jgi:hypothetical protein
MTALALETTTEDRLRAVLLIDGIVTAAVGVLFVLAPSSWYGDSPGWLVRTVGVVLALVGLEVGLASRWSGRRLRLAGLVTAESAFAWTLGSLVVMAIVDLPTVGLEVVGVVAVGTLVFGLVETRLVRALHC